MDLRLLACPRCSRSLMAAQDALQCSGCAARYGIRHGVPDLLPWSGGTPGAEWEAWRHKLELLQQWRRDTWDGSVTASALQKLADDHVSEFLRFARVPEGGVVLEIGCGSGALGGQLPGRRYVGVDPMPLHAGPPGSVILQAVGEKLPLVDAAFDAVLLCETIDHALDPRRVLREAKRTLKPGGVLAVLQSVRVSLPNPPLLVRLRVMAGRWKARLSGVRRGTSDDQTKMHVFTPEALSALAQDEFVLDSAVTQGQSLYLRARKAGA